MRRRDLIRAAAVLPIASAAMAQAPAAQPAAAPKFPDFAKLQKGKRDSLDLIAKVKLANGDAPDGLPHPPVNGRRK